MLTKIIENLILIGKSNLRFQKFYEKLLEVSLVGMNIGMGGDLSSDGELNVLRYIRNKCLPSKNIVVFDVGANVGNYSLKILKEFKNLRLEFYSFEPSKETFFELKKRLKNFPELRLYNIGFGEESGTKTLFSNKKKSVLASMYDRRLLHFGVKMNRRELIKVETLDDFCQRQRIREIDLLKLDTEGNEFNILRGAKKMIRKNAIRFIQFEFGGCNIDSRTYFQDFFYLLTGKYYIYRILKDGFYRIDSYKEIYELFLTTNFLAELK